MIGDTSQQDHVQESFSPLAKDLPQRILRREDKVTHSLPLRANELLGPSPEVVELVSITIFRITHEITLHAPIRASRRISYLYRTSAGTKHHSGEGPKPDHYEEAGRTLDSGDNQREEVRQ